MDIILQTKLLFFKKYERSEYIINAFDLAFAFETTRAKRVPFWHGGSRGSAILTFGMAIALPPQVV